MARTPQADSEWYGLLHTIRLFIQLIVFAHADFHFELGLDENHPSFVIPRRSHLPVHVFVLRQVNARDERFSERGLRAVFVIQARVGPSDAHLLHQGYPGAQLMFYQGLPAVLLVLNPVLLL